MNGITSSTQVIRRRSSESPWTRITQDFLLVWLNENIDDITDSNCCTLISELQKVISNVNIFSDSDQCIDFVIDIELIR